jgi:hypothetical protein
MPVVNQVDRWVEGGVLRVSAEGPLRTVLVAVGSDVDCLGVRLAGQHHGQKNNGNDLFHALNY